MSRSLASLILFLFVTQLALAQSIGRIEGRIVSERNEPLLGISVALEGTTLGTTTDEEGKYVIKSVAPGSYTLVASGVGYTTVKRSIEVKGGSTITEYFLLPSSATALSEVVVTTSKSGEFVQPIGSTATKMEAPLKSVPQSVQIISRRAMDQMQVIRLDDAMRNVSGVTMETGFGGRTDIFQIRGFRTSTESIFKNGFRNSVRTFRETANIQQLEVMKGPASVLYGVSDPGGMVNITTKKPTAFTFQDIQLTANSFGQYRPAIDFGGALNEEKTLKYRMNAVFEKSDTYRDFVSTKRFFVAPALTYDFSDRTSLTVEAEYLDHDQASDRGIVAFNKVIADVPTNRSIGEPDNVGRHQNRLVQYNLQHRFNDIFSLRHASNFTYSSEERKIIESQGVLQKEIEKDVFVDVDGKVIRRLQDQYNFERNYATQNELYATFKTGAAFEHKTVVGVELAHSTFDIWYNRGAYDTLDIYKPQYSRLPKPTKLKFGDDYRDITKLYGVYVQDFLSVSQKLKVLLGARYDIWDLEKVNQKLDKKTNTFSGVTTAQRNTAFNPRVGVLYELVGPLSVYGNWSRGFQPEVGRVADRFNADSTAVISESLKPVTSELMEAGFKAGLLNDKVNIKAAYFNIVRQNVPLEDLRAKSDPRYAGLVMQVGEVRSEGFEADVTGEVVTGLNVIATYSYTDAIITKDVKEGLVGTQFRGVSKHSGSLWTTYELQDGALKGLGIGGGFTSFGDRPVDATDSFRLPGYTRYDATVYYDNQKYHAAINVKNLTNVKYYDGSQSATAIMPGAPISVQGTIGVRF
ncbi:TonB-dependent receptor [Pontibacter sp. KCTC 32443]|uniref:TonB-dependent receptor n=1 Tax=Pontibacter TaxID=323449 RepID=UPI00164D386E|nr:MULTISPECIES: TonB-dependent receptor [Pontibacter]MBC5772823.1 TonB-dependent receptor [Pontibacter sp. KCTC 32443]